MLLKPGVENKEYLFMFSGLDKLLHLSIFFLLGLLILLAFPKIKILPFLGILLFYGVLTEYLQYAMDMGRAAEGLDLLADVLGGGLAWLFFIRYYPKRFK
jgi:VanZ family protein